ncbi:MAG TPA: AAA family ATPase [Roseiflexaceae bacterium]|jgi:MoxR-like ATPase|nr:AAA family ATPase [Roseiflexaceae bacterium]
MSTPATPFPGFTPEILGALLEPGIAERWAAVQERLHPALLALTEALQAEGARRFPHEWPLYELSFKSQRYVNRGAGERAPIDEYHVALDRPPRGCGIYIVVSGEERRIVVALQLLRPRKSDLRHVWEDQRVVWQPLVERMNDVRFAEPRPARKQGDRETSRQGEQEAHDATSPLLPLSPSTTWLDRYLAARGAAYLLAGFAYSWDDERVQQPGFAAQIIEDALALFPLNEAIMEQAEALEPTGAALLREQRAVYGQTAQTPIETIVERVRARGFALDEALIRAYHVALQTKPLVILPGISGTGKTRLTRLYADAVYNIPAGQQNEHYLLVAVQPDWHNARDLLGYYNALTSTFHPTPFLRFLLRAASDPATPYFVCLDEMNLARPEYYLAPVLSALETEDHEIDLGVPGATVESTTGETLQNPFRLPLNVRITGTVNVDESTHTLSDKLLDRANVIELTDVDLAAFRQSYHGPVDEEAWQTITQIHEIVTRAGQPFGYRTVTEMLRYIEQARGVLPANQALDQQIRQKILPKLRGEDTPRLRRALTNLLELLLGMPQSVWNRAAAVEPEQVARAPFPSSAEKVRRMLERLDSEGFTDFYS